MTIPGKVNLLDMAPAAAQDRLGEFFARAGEPSYRAGQVL